MLRGFNHYAPPRLNTQCLSLLVRSAEIFQRVESKGDMNKAGGLRIFVLTWHVNEGNAMMFVIIAISQSQQEQSSMGGDRT